MVVDGLDRRHDPEKYSLPGGHKRKLIRKARADRVEKESLERVVVQSSVGVRNVESVVPRVERS